MNQGTAKGWRSLHFMAHHEVGQENARAFRHNLAVLVNAGAAIDATTLEGETPLHHALCYGGVITFSLFLEPQPNLQLRTK